jgi:5-methylthioadenosine/S-adenosylhomocysteine deaminase
MAKLKISLVLFISFLLIFPQSSIAQNRTPLPEKNVPGGTADLVIAGGTVVTMDEGRRVIEDGAVVVKDGAIVLVGERAAVTKNLKAKQTIDARGKIVIPGLINTHTHIPMTLFRGIADDLDLQEWLTKYIFPAEAKNVDEAFVRAGTRLGLAEFISGGTTTFCDMYYFEDAVADETAKAGLRGVLGQTLIDFPAPDHKTFDEALKSAENFVKKWRNDRLIVPAVAPHAPYTVSEEHLKAAKNLSDKYEAPLVIHVAETETEVATVREQKNLRVVEYLESIGFLNDRVIAAHVVFADAGEIDILNRRGVGVAHNPQSNMKLASGVAPVPAMLEKGVRLGLGTDGAASNNDLNLWEEMDAAAKLHKVFTRDPKAVSAEQAFAMATIDGARALHLENLIGSLEAGKRADIAIVDFAALHQTPVYNIYSHLVYATKASDVHTVIVDGRVLMRDKRLLTLDESAIKKDANLYRQKIINSLR